MCDGTVDCPDFSDELYCEYCPEKHFHCGVGQQCIDKNRMCDGVRDCDNGDASCTVVPVLASHDRDALRRRRRRSWCGTV